LEEERRALAAFVSKFDALGLGYGPSKLQPPMPIPGGAPAAFAGRRSQVSLVNENGDSSPVRLELGAIKAQPSLLEQMPEEEWSVVEDMSFELEVEKRSKGKSGLTGKSQKVFAEKENLPV
jgi:centromeric protein E